ncbi:hypothetical protein Vse01_36230 [Micromonospora sediminimaris]|uniref:Uncharacterized protein n=1 Tax=Micromonospora sediminimaris TaxID=547162 RepID=A0A9W5XKL8_9ACTN|nr:hypothetical protein Vse01_36230 [Micromonospora sediminimaris]
MRRLTAPAPATNPAGAVAGGTLGGQGVRGARWRTGMHLAMQASATADLVVPLLGSKIPGAQGYAQQSGSSCGDAFGTARTSAHLHGPHPGDAGERCRSAAHRRLSAYGVRYRVRYAPTYGIRIPTPKSSAVCGPPCRQAIPPSMLGYQRSDHNEQSGRGRAYRGLGVISFAGEE